MKKAFTLLFTIVMIIAAPTMAVGQEPSLAAAPGDPLAFSPEQASMMSQMALKCLEQEFPNKPDHVLVTARDAQTPKYFHPAFYGCFDWHSAVHGHWMLIRLLKLFPKIPEGAKIRTVLNKHLTAAHILQEAKYMDTPDRRSFERTYGWAWLLKLVQELHDWDDAEGKIWRQNLAPLENKIVSACLEFLPKQGYAIRTGVHPNTAFGISFALDYARGVKNAKMEEILMERADFYYYQDEKCPADWEPGGEDFFSPCLMEAELMRKVLKAEDFPAWFAKFLPGIREYGPLCLMDPATVSDRSDGKLVHLDGLNLSRAWCMKNIARSLPETDPARPQLLKSAAIHARTTLDNIRSGDYAGEHWLATFAILMLTD